MKRFAIALVLCACDQGSPRCADGEIKAAGECILNADVQVGLGFLPERMKRATVPGGATSFVVRREDGSAAFDGSTEGPLEGDTGAELRIADFSALQEEGSFYVEAAGVGRSASFRIAADVFREPLETALLGLHGQRCGEAVVVAYGGNEFSHAACHENDAWLGLLDGRNEIKPSTGGWHDAGDYGKYTVNGAFSAGMLLAAWEHFGDKLASIVIPDTTGDLPDYLDELAYQVEWLLTMQIEDGSASHKVTAREFELLTTAPQEDHSQRFFAPAGSAATASLVAATAMAARVYADYNADLSARCLAAARRGWTWLESHPGELKPDLSQFHTGGYQTGDADDRLWAAAELWETTGEDAFLVDFEARAAGQSVRMEWDWGDVGNLGVFTYLTSERVGRNTERVASLSESALAVANLIVDNANQHAYGRGIGSKYYWGINGTVVRTALNLEVAYRLDPQASYRDAALQQVEHVLGRNAQGRSQLTGVGYHPPLFPHHRPSASDGVLPPWPGLLVGGAWPKATDWVDAQDNYETNEVALNWNAALVYALAELLP